MAIHLVLWAVKILKLVAVTTATTLAGLATSVAPATDLLTERLAHPTPCRAVVITADARILGSQTRILSSPASHRGAERVTVRAISHAVAAASASPVSVRCSIVSRDEWMRRAADPST